MTYIVFLPLNKLCPLLIYFYKMLDDCKNFQMSNAVANKRKVIVFVKEWCDIARDAFYEEPLIKELLQV
jgi:hypothetical protein